MSDEKDKSNVELLIALAKLIETIDQKTEEAATRLRQL